MQMQIIRTEAARFARIILENAISNGNAFVVMEIAPDCTKENLSGNASVCGFEGATPDGSYKDRLKVATAVLELSRVIAAPL